MSIFRKAYQKARALYLRIRFGKVVIVAVMITQALKRFVESELGKFLLDMLPIPWLDLSSSIFGLLIKANTFVPKVAQEILLSHAFLDGANEQDALQLLTIHLRSKTKEERADFWKEFYDKLTFYMSDGKISNEERDELRDEYYHKLFKK